MAVIDGSNRFQVLCHEQVSRLSNVMEDEIPIHGRGNFPTLYVKLKNLVRLVKAKLADENINVRDIRINGGVASYVLGSDGSNDVRPYNDLDLIFGVDLLGPNELQKIKSCVLNCLLDFLPKETNKDKMTSCALKEAYVQKLVKICTAHGDRWSLISLSNVRGKNVELKFVDTMKRQFEFSVDSFQIILDSLLTFYEVAETPMSEHFYPTVVAESVYGDFTEAWHHLNKKLIATRKPEEIRGGGLLKYCNLIVRDYQPAANVEIRELERYMCSRFFIDFSNIHMQRQKLESYLAYHFIGEEDLKYDYLMTLYRVVDESTICLMGHERRQTLNLIYEFACQVLLEHERKMHKLLQIQHFDQLSKLTVDQVYYGPITPFTQYFGYEPIHAPYYQQMCNRNNNGCMSPAMSPAAPVSPMSPHGMDLYQLPPPQVIPCPMCPPPQIPPYLQCS